MSIKFALLSLLEEEPRAVAQLRSTFEERTSSTWPINVGQVYQTIQRLDRDDLIKHHSTDESGPGRAAEVYEITDAGRQALRDWWSTPVLPPRDTRNELVIKIAMSVASPTISTRALIQSQRRALMKELAEVTRHKAAAPAVATADRLLLEHRIFELEAQGRWLDLIDTLPATS